MLNSVKASPLPAAPPASFEREHAIAQVGSFEALIAASLDDDIELTWWAPSVVAGKIAASPAFDDFRVTGPRRKVMRAFRNALTRIPVRPGLQETLKADAARIIDTFECVYPETEFQIRLEYIEDDACRRFHQDNTDLRFLATYEGPGTEWCSTDQCLHGQLPTGALAILRGVRSDRPSKILHRSPAIDGTGGHRVLLVVDIERPGWFDDSNG